MKRVKRIALGAAVSLAAYTGLCALLSLLIVRGTAPESCAPACTLAAALAAVLCGALLSSGGTGERAVNAFSCAAAFWCAAVLLGFLACDALQPGRAAMLALASAAGGALACLAHGEGGRGKRRRRSRK